MGCREIGNRQGGKGMNPKHVIRYSCPVEIYPDRESMGTAAGRKVEEKLLKVLEKPGTIARVIFAAAPSQNEVLAYLAASARIDWSRVVAFHMDEYIGLVSDAPQRFGNFLKAAIFSKVPLKEVHYLDPQGNPEAEAREYARLLRGAPVDVVILGVGENGHIAFNDPPVADFKDPRDVKIVELDGVCRNQQVNDGCFATRSDVPAHALTLTIPMLLSGKHLICTVPGPTKATAVRHMVTGPVTTECPASILRLHPDCSIFLDRESGKEIM